MQHTLIIVLTIVFSVMYIALITRAACCCFIATSACFLEHVQHERRGNIWLNPFGGDRSSILVNVVAVLHDGSAKISYYTMW